MCYVIPVSLLYDARCGLQESWMPDVPVIFLSCNDILIMLLALVVCEMNIIVLTEKSKLEHNFISI